MKKYIILIVTFGVIYFVFWEKEEEKSGFFNLTEEEYKKAEKTYDSLLRFEQKESEKSNIDSGPFNKSFEYNFVLNHIRLSSGGDFNNAFPSQHTIQVKDDIVVISDGSQQHQFSIISAPRKEYDSNLGEYTSFYVIGNGGDKQRLLFYKDYYFGVIQVVSRTKMIWYLN